MPRLPRLRALALLVVAVLVALSGTEAVGAQEATDSLVVREVDGHSEFGIVLALDTSGSMGTGGGFERAQDGVLDLVDLDVATLERLTSATGGSVLAASAPEDLDQVYAEVPERLRDQYQTTFASESGRDGPSELTPVVVVDDGGVEALQSEVFLWVGIVLALLAVVGVVFAVGTSLFRDRSSLDHVLGPYADDFDDHADLGDRDDRLATTAILARAVEMTGHFAERRGVLRRVEDMLEQANLPLRAAEAFFFHLVAVVLLTTLGGLLGGIVGAVLVFVLAVAIPPGVVAWMAGRRRTQFQDQLPDLLSLLASTLRSGYSLMQGVEAAAQETVDPARGELQRVVSEARLGMRLEDSLHNVAVRMRSRDFGWTVMAVGIQREVGGNLAELLDVVASTVRERGRLRRDVQSLTAEGRMSAIVLGILPVAVGLLLFTVNREYMESLLDDAFGVVMLVSSGLLMLVGFVWMYKIIDIEV